jgi:RNase P subunit RPR2
LLSGAFSVVERIEMNKDLYVVNDIIVACSNCHWEARFNLGKAFTNLNKNVALKLASKQHNCSRKG